MAIIFITVVKPASLAKVVVTAEVAAVPHLPTVTSRTTAPAGNVAAVAGPAGVIVRRLYEGMRVPRMHLGNRSRVAALGTTSEFGHGKKAKKPRKESRFGSDKRQVFGIRWIELQGHRQPPWQSPKATLGFIPVAVFHRFFRICRVFLEECVRAQPKEAVKFAPRMRQAVVNGLWLFAGQC
jgi:hypothetical protein